MLNPLTKDKNCYLCPLSDTAKLVVWGDGPTDSDIMFIAQNPGKIENKSGRPMDNDAKTGKEFNWLCDRHGMHRNSIYVTNQTKCYGPNDRDPNPDEVEACAPYLLQEIAQIRPKFIVTIGAYSTRKFIHNYTNLESIHGIPFEATITLPGPEQHTTTVIPMFHTAAGLHAPDKMLIIQMDFARLREIVAGRVPTRHIEDPYAGTETYEHAGSVGNIRYLLKGAKYIAIDTEDCADGSPWSIQFSREPGTGYIIYAHEELFVSTLKEILETPGVITIIQNAIHDIPVLAAMGIDPFEVKDTMVMAYLLQSEPQGLKPLAYRHHGMEMHSFTEQVVEATRDKALKYLAEAVEWDFPDPEPILTWPKGEPHIKQPKNINGKIASILVATTTKAIDKEVFLTNADDPNTADPYTRWGKIKLEEGRDIVEEALGPMRQGYLEDIDPDQALFYASRDPDATLRVYDSLAPQIKSLGLGRALDIDMAAIPMGIEMMKNGFPVDIPYLQGLSSYFDDLLTKQERRFTEETGLNINIDSNQQVAHVLFDVLNLPVIKRTKKERRPATGDEVLTKLEGKHPVIPVIQKFRELSKLKGTYTDTIPKLAVWDGDSGCWRVHTTIRFTRTATGRLSSADPNLQNQPTRTDEGRQIRGGFIASDGCLLLSCDYSQIELVGMAHDSGDKRMLEIFSSGGDIHAQTASDMFGIALGRLDDKKHRYPAKRVNFGIPYGITAQGLYREFLLAGLKEWSVPRCQEFIDTWFELYPGVAEYFKQIKLQARAKGYVTDYFGRIRFIPGVRAKDKYLQEEALRQAGNMPIQALAAGVIKIAMADTYKVSKDFQKMGIICRPLLQVHDDLIFEVQKSEIDYVAPVIQSVMETAVTLKVPTPVDPKVGKVWNQMEEYHVA
jgi:uracil-DNA glycosylase family 4